MNGGTVNADVLFTASAAVTTNFTMSSGAINTNAAGNFTWGNTSSVAANNTLNFSGGTVDVDGVTLLSGGIAANFSGGSWTSNGLTLQQASDTSTIDFTGGTYNLGTLTHTTSSSNVDFTFSGNAKLTLAGITPDGDLGYTYDFSSGWTGFLGITGNSSLNDYWATLQGASNIVLLDGSVIDKTIFDSTFLLTESNALTLIPEPSALGLLIGGLATLALVRRRRVA